MNFYIQKLPLLRAKIDQQKGRDIHRLVNLINEDFPCSAPIPSPKDPLGLYAYIAYNFQLAKVYKHAINTPSSAQAAQKYLASFEACLERAHQAALNFQNTDYLRTKNNISFARYFLDEDALLLTEEYAKNLQRILARNLAKTEPDTEEHQTIKRYQANLYAGAQDFKAAERILAEEDATASKLLLGKIHLMASAASNDPTEKENEYVKAFTLGISPTNPFDSLEARLLSARFMLATIERNQGETGPTTEQLATLGELLEDDVLNIRPFRTEKNMLVARVLKLARNPLKAWETALKSLESLPSKRNLETETLMINIASDILTEQHNHPKKKLISTVMKISAFSQSCWDNCLREGAKAQPHFYSQSLATLQGLIYGESGDDAKILAYIDKTLPNAPDLIYTTDETALLAASELHWLIAKFYSILFENHPSTDSFKKSMTDNLMLAKRAANRHPDLTVRETMDDRALFLVYSENDDRQLLNKTYCDALTIAFERALNNPTISAEESLTLKTKQAAFFARRGDFLGAEAILSNAESPLPLPTALSANIYLIAFEEQENPEQKQRLFNEAKTAFSALEIDLDNAKDISLQIRYLLASFDTALDQGNDAEQRKAQLVDLLGKEALNTMAFAVEKCIFTTRYFKAIRDPVAAWKTAVEGLQSIPSERNPALESLMDSLLGDIKDLDLVMPESPILDVLNLSEFSANCWWWHSHGLKKSGTEKEILKPLITHKKEDSFTLYTPRKFSRRITKKNVGWTDSDANTSRHTPHRKKPSASKTARKTSASPYHRPDSPSQQENRPMASSPLVATSLFSSEKTSGTSSSGGCTSDSGTESESEESRLETTRAFRSYQQ